MKYETSNWRIERGFRAFPDFISCEVVEGATRYPSGAEEMEIGFWNSAIDRKMELLKGDSDNELMLEHIGPRKSLSMRKRGQEDYKGNMTPGFQYRLVDFRPDEQVLVLERVRYSEIEALKDPGYRKLFEDKGLPVPHGPVAPVYYILTQNGYIVGTRRSEATNKYPGGIWGVGGDIDDPILTVGEHLRKREALEEFRNFGGLSFQPVGLGIVFDKALMKHDMPVITSYSTVFEKVRKGGGFLPDVESVVPIPDRSDELADYIKDNFVGSVDETDRNWIGKPTPACSAGLFLVGGHMYGKGWSDEVYRELK